MNVYLISHYASKVANNRFNNFYQSPQNLLALSSENNAQNHLKLVGYTFTELQYYLYSRENVCGYRFLENHSKINWALNQDFYELGTI